MTSDQTAANKVKIVLIARDKVTKDGIKFKVKASAIALRTFDSLRCHKYMGKCLKW